MSDISNREDIIVLIDQFYNKATSDSIIGHIFQNHMTETLVKHKPIICDFWESVLLEKGSYKGNPIKKHIDLSRRTGLGNFHFKQWLKLWEETVDQLYKSKIADEAKAKATLMKDLMLIKIRQSENPNFIA